MLLAQINLAVNPDPKRMVFRLLQDERDLHVQSAANRRRVLKRIPRETTSGRAVGISPAAGIPFISARQVHRVWRTVALRASIAARAAAAFSLTRPLPPLPGFQTLQKVLPDFDRVPLFGVSLLPSRSGKLVQVETSDNFCASVQGPDFRPNELGGSADVIEQARIRLPSLDPRAEHRS